MWYEGKELEYLANNEAAVEVEEYEKEWEIFMKQLTEGN